MAARRLPSSRTILLRHFAILLRPSGARAPNTNLRGLDMRLQWFLIVAVGLAAVGCKKKKKEVPAAPDVAAICAALCDKETECNPPGIDDCDAVCAADISSCDETFQTYDCLAGLDCVDYMGDWDSTECVDELDAETDACYSFDCGDGGRFPLGYLCDGDGYGYVDGSLPDCDNGFDEGSICVACTDPRTLPCTAPGAGPSCIPSVWECDTVADCEDGSDELGC
jgi:hypothetical protein